MILKRESIDAMCRHALETYPDECCGIISGKNSEETVHICDNVQNKLHTEDPLRYPRDARTAYAIDRHEAEGIFSEARVQGSDIVAFYHSHTDHEAYFSDMDREVQTVFGEPEFPEALHIVISVRDNRIHDVKYFRWDREKNDFFPLT